MSLNAGVNGDAASRVLSNKDSPDSREAAARLVTAALYRKYAEDAIILKYLWSSAVAAGLLARHPTACHEVGTTPQLRVGLLARDSSVNLQMMASRRLARSKHNQLPWQRFLRSIIAAYSP